MAINADAAAVLMQADRRAHRWRRFRATGMVIGWLLALHARAVERAYAPGGLGYHEVEADFEERAQKAQRVK